MTHELKCWPEFFSLILSGEKNFEVRKTDRPFRPGDILRLQEYIPTFDNIPGRYTRRSIDKLVTYVMLGDPHGLGLLADDVCVMSLGDPPPTPDQS